MEQCALQRALDIYQPVRIKEQPWTVRDLDFKELHYYWTYREPQPSKEPNSQVEGFQILHQSDHLIARTW